MVELSNWWLFPCVILALYNMYVLYNLGAPASFGSRVARTLGMMSCLSVVFAPFEARLGVDFLSELSFFLLSCSYAAQNSQFHIEDKEWQKKMAAKKSPKGIVDAIVHSVAEHKGPTP